MLYTERINQNDQAELAEVLDIPRLFRHRFSTDTFLKSYRRMAKIAAGAKLSGLREIAPHLLALIADEKTLHTALVHMQTNASHVPGPNGLRYSDIEEVGAWSWCRIRRDEIRAGQYVRAAEYVQKISKGPGRGFRELTIQSVEDRIVQRAIVEILQPLLDPLFDPRSFGYRPQKSPLHALLCVEQLHEQVGHKVWVSADIKNAFPNVPVGRLLAVVRKYLPNDELIEFVAKVIEPDKTPGLRQGSPLSPLLLNLYLHHVLDRPWRNAHPHIPLIRFADDILLVCRTRKEANSAYQALAELLQPAGFKLKEDQSSAVHHLAKGDRVRWMGYEIATTNSSLTYSVTEQAWDKLAESFETAHSKPHSPIRAIQSLAAWINAKAPCYPQVDLPTSYERMQSLAAQYGFTEILLPVEVADLWQLAYARWCKLRHRLST